VCFQNVLHIQNKPAKYGIEIMMACDARSKFMLNAIPSPENTPKKLKMRKMLVSMQVSLMLRLLMSSQKLWRNIPLKNWLQNTGTALGMSLPTTGSCQFPLSKGREKLSAYVLYVGTLHQKQLGNSGPNS